MLVEAQRRAVADLLCQPDATIGRDQRRPGTDDRAGPDRRRVDLRGRRRSLALHASDLQELRLQPDSGDGARRDQRQTAAGEQHVTVVVSDSAEPAKTAHATLTLDVVPETSSLSIATSRSSCWGGI